MTSLLKSVKGVKQEIFVESERGVYWNLQVKRKIFVENEKCQGWLLESPRLVHFDCYSECHTVV